MQAGLYCNQAGRRLGTLRIRAFNLTKCLHAMMLFTVRDHGTPDVFRTKARINIGVTSTLQLQRPLPASERKQKGCAGFQFGRTSRPKHGQRLASGHSSGLTKTACLARGVTAQRAQNQVYTSLSPRPAKIAASRGRDAPHARGTVSRHPAQVPALPKHARLQSDACAAQHSGQWLAERERFDSSSIASTCTAVHRQGSDSRFGSVIRDFVSRARL